MRTTRGPGPMGNDAKLLGVSRVAGITWTCYKVHRMQHVQHPIEDKEPAMKKLTIREARQALSHLDRLLPIEGESLLTRRGVPIARVVQVGKRRRVPSHRDLRASMPRMRKGSQKSVREDRDAR